MCENIGLYRGKRVDNDRWIEGVYYRQTLYYGESIERHYIITSTESLDNDICLEYYEVIPESVGQFTCLLDKNGMKIFRGDIISGYNCPVVFDKGLFYVQISKIIGIPLSDVCKKVEKIGNIYDNPELLK